MCVKLHCIIIFHPGYCGADIKCLVTEATQNALRRHYPQIYTTSDKLQLDVSSITLTARDFAEAVNTIVPAAQRAVSNPAMALEASVRPLLSVSLMKLQSSLFKRFPYSKLDRRANSAAALQGLLFCILEGPLLLCVTLPESMCCLTWQNMKAFGLPTRLYG